MIEKSLFNAIFLNVNFKIYLPSKRLEKYQKKGNLTYLGNEILILTGIRSVGLALSTCNSDRTSGKTKK